MLPQRLHHRIILASTILLCGCCLQSMGPRPDESKANNATQAIMEILGSPALDQATIGISVVGIGDRQLLFSKNEHKLLHPASTTKLFTTALVLEYLGPWYQYNTRVSGSAPQAGNVEDLYLIGSGDPSLTGQDLESLAKKLHKHNIRQIGTIFCDATIFDDIAYGHGWMWDDQPYQDFAPLSGLSVNQNVIEIQVSPQKTAGPPPKVSTTPATSFMEIQNRATTSRTQNNDLSVARDEQNRVTITGTIGIDNETQSILRNVEHPALYAGTLLMEECQKLGIKVINKPRHGKTPQDARILAEHTSVPLSELIRAMNKDSLNLYAELLLKTVAHEQTAELGSAKQGLILLEELLQKWHISPNQFTFADGSGISRYNLVTPETLTDLLIHLYKDAQNKESFISSLAIGGLDGDLDWRMEALSQSPKVFAKTGYLRGVSTLAGFINLDTDTPIAFSIMIQHFKGSALPILQAQDQLVEQFCKF